jgi:hypothetical protein
MVESAHSDTVLCEACSNVGPVNIVGKMLLCSACEEKENKPPEPKVDSERLSLDTIVNQVNRLVDSKQIESMNGDSVKSMIDEAIQGNIKQFTDFFNAKMPSIVELKNMIDNDETIVGTENKTYALATACRKRTSYLARVLFQLKEGELETAAEIKSIHTYVQKLIPELRVKLRHEFAENTPGYTPQVVKADKPKIRAKGKSVEERLAEGYAKMMKIPYEQALKLLKNKLKDDCTCAETPGVCVVHMDVTNKEIKEGAK